MLVLLATMPKNKTNQREKLYRPVINKTIMKEKLLSFRNLLTIANFERLYYLHTFKFVVYWPTVLHTHTHTHIL